MAIRFEGARLVAAVTLATAGCGLYGVDGNGHRATETRPLQGFTAVVADGSLDVQIRSGDTFNVEVSIDSNLLHDARTDLTDGGDTLSIDLDGPVWDILPGPHVIVTMPELQRAVLNGSGSVTATGFQQPDPLALELDGSGVLTYDGQVPSADAVPDQTALMGAAERGYTPFVKFLAEHGADLSLKDARGRTALDLAKGVGVAGVKQAQGEGFPETAKLLETLAASKNVAQATP